MQATDRLLSILSPLADIDQWRSMGKQFSGPNLRLQVEDYYGFALLVVAFGLLFVVLRWVASVQKAMRESPPSCPKRLSQELALSHRLGRGDQRRLKLLAEAAGLSDTAELFIRPEVFRGAAAETVVTPAQLAELRGRLFGSADG